jgi:hypothetical protein
VDRAVRARRGPRLRYLSQALGSSRQGSVWLDLSTSTDSSYQRARQKALAGLIRRILTIPAELDRYTAYLASALRVDEGAIVPLLWDHPRPLLTQVLPTALRRLESNWRAWRQAGNDFQVSNSPLPEFAPANLFSDLNLPEVNIVLPQPGRATPDEVAMPIAQALREFAPGRVSRRYGISHAFERHWMCPALDQHREQMVPLEPFARLDRLGDWQISIAGSVRQVPVFRPRVLEVQPPPGTVVDTSNARLRWQSQLVAREPGLVLEPPRASPWTPLVEDVRFYSHEGLSPVEVRRMALGSTAGIRFRDVTAGPREADDVLAGIANGEIWISEMTPGGNGQIEEAQRQYVEDPRRFFSLMTAALRDNDFSLSDYQLGRFLAAVVEGDRDDPLPVATQGFRHASGAEESHAAFTTLRHTLAEEGFVTFHAFLVALANRILRPGSSVDSDPFFLDAVRLWDAEEARLGVELDARVLAYHRG